MALITVEGDGVSLIFEEISAELAEAITTKRIDEAVFDGLTGATHYDSGLTGNIKIFVDGEPHPLEKIQFDPERHISAVKLGEPGTCYFVSQTHERGEWFIYEVDAPFDAEKFHPQSVTYTLPDGSEIRIIKVFYGDEPSEIDTIAQDDSYYVLMANGTRREIKFIDE